MKAHLLLVIGIILTLALPAAADVVVLRDGRALTGEVLNYDANGITLRVAGLDYFVASYAIDGVTLQRGYQPPLPSVSPAEVWTPGWAEAQPYAYSGLAGVGQLRRALEVTGAVVNIRGGPGTDHPILRQAARGDLLTAIAGVSGWYRLLFTDQTTGWIAADLVKPLQHETEVMMGTAGYGATWTAPPQLAGYPPAPTAEQARAYEYWRQQYWDNYLRSNVGGLSTGAAPVPTR